MKPEKAPEAEVVNGTSAGKWNMPRKISNNPEWPARFHFPETQSDFSDPPPAAGTSAIEEPFQILGPFLSCHSGITSDIY